MSQSTSRKCIPRQLGIPNLEEVVPRRQSARLLAKARAEAATASSHSGNPVGNSYSLSAPTERGTSASFSSKTREGRHKAVSLLEEVIEATKTFLLSPYMYEISKELAKSPDENAVKTCDSPCTVVKKAQTRPPHEGDDTPFWEWKFERKVPEAKSPLADTVSVSENQSFESAEMSEGNSDCKRVKIYEESDEETVLFPWPPSKSPSPTSTSERYSTCPTRKSEAVETDSYPSTSAQADHKPSRGFEDDEERLRHPAYNLESAIEEKTERINQLIAAYKAPRSRQTAEYEEIANATFERVCGEVRRKDEKGKEKRPASPLTKGVRLKKRLVEINRGKNESKGAEARSASEGTSTTGRVQRSVN